MDPLSMTASIIALIQASSSIFSYVRDIKDASKECKKLGLEVGSTRGLLDTLKDTVEDVQDQSNWAATLKALEDPGNPIKMLSLVLEPLKLKLDKAASAKGFKRFTKSLLWPLTSKATEEVLLTVERQKSLLMIALENDHFRLSAASKKQVGEIQKTVQQIQEDVRDLGEAISTVKLSQQGKLVNFPLMSIRTLTATRRIEL